MAGRGNKNGHGHARGQQADGVNTGTPLLDDDDDDDDDGEKNEDVESSCR